MPEGISGLALQKIMADRQLLIPIVFITSFGTITLSVKAMKAGAIDFLENWKFSVSWSKEC